MTSTERQLAEARVDELVDELFRVCKAHDIPMIVAAEITNPETGNLSCRTARSGGQLAREGQLTHHLFVASFEHDTMNNAARLLAQLFPEGPEQLLAFLNERGTDGDRDGDDS